MIVRLFAIFHTETLHRDELGLGDGSSNGLYDGLIEWAIIDKSIWGHL